MSETTEHPAPEPEREPTPAPAPSPESTPAPDAEPAEQTEEERQQRESRGDRRFAAITAKLSAAERLQAQQAAELEFYRRQAVAQPQGEETPEQRYQRERVAIRAEVEAQIRTERFHEQGATEFTDWKARCDDLVKMGADAGFAQLLVEMPDGVRVAGALAADPEAVERIAGLHSERARAVALGKFAATLGADNGNGNGNGNGHARAAAPLPVTRAPAPVRPVTGRASPVFNEYTASPEALADYYLKKDLERHRSRR
jgi:hypothetical protein